MSTDVVLLTRFNLPSGGEESLIRAKEGWLRHRAELFGRYTLPSVAAQRTAPTAWLIYFDVASPQWLRDRVDAWRSEVRFTPLYRTTVPASDQVNDLREAVSYKSELLITANLDNDDSIASDFVERLADVSTPDLPHGIYLASGLIRTNDRLYLHHDPLNAFVAVLDRWDRPRTCWADWHNLIGRMMPVTTLAGDPAWLQVVHGRNVSNRVHGRIVSPLPYRDLFPGLIEDVPPPSKTAMFEDRYLRGTGRALREAIRSGVKAAALRLGGKDALALAKVTFRHLRTVFRNPA